MRSLSIKLITIALVSCSSYDKKQEITSKRTRTSAKGSGNAIPSTESKPNASTDTIDEPSSKTNENPEQVVDEPETEIEPTNPTLPSIPEGKKVGLIFEGLNNTVVLKSVIFEKNGEKKVFESLDKKTANLIRHIVFILWSAAIGSI